RAAAATVGQGRPAHRRRAPRIHDRLPQLTPAKVDRRTAAALPHPRSTTAADAIVLHRRGERRAGAARAFGAPPSRGAFFARAGAAGAVVTPWSPTTFCTVSHVRVVTSSPNVFWISVMNTGPRGPGT